MLIYIQTFVWAFSLSSSFAGGGVQQAWSGFGILSWSLRVKQKQPTQKPTKDETSSSISKSWIFTGSDESTEYIL